MKYLISLMILGILVFFTSCSDNSSGPNENQGIPVITNINPSNISIGDNVTITGTGFGNTRDTSIVTFNTTKAATITSWSNTVINVKVPTGTTAGKLTVTVAGKVSNGVDFTMMTPVITNINPSSVLIGDDVTITGTGFGESQEISIVTFNTTNAITILGWSNTVINARVPAGTTAGKLTVTVGGKVSNGVDFTMKTPEVLEEVTIGSFTWTAKNVTVDRYRNGDPIPEITDTAAWRTATTGAWCYYNNDPENGKVYGKLYNWYAVNDPRGFAPAGWHVPSDEEWTEFEQSALVNSDGGKLKATGTIEDGTGLWKTPNSNATNTTGFSAVPTGVRVNDGKFDYQGLEVRFWTSTFNKLSNTAYVRDLLNSSDIILNSNLRPNVGISVRLMKDK